MDILFLLFVAALLGLIPAVIASKKGRSFGEWWLYGFLLFIVALVHSILVGKNIKGIEEKEIQNGGKRCPFCAEVIKAEAVKCRFCNSDLPHTSSLEEPFNMKEIDYVDLCSDVKGGLILSDEKIRDLAIKMKKNYSSPYPSHILAGYKDDLSYLKCSMPTEIQEYFIKRIEYWVKK